MGPAESAATAPPAERTSAFTGVHTDGGFQEYTIAEEDYTFPIPDRFTDGEAAPLLCAGVVGYRSLRLSGVEPGQRLGLYGFGASAHIVLQVARSWGCRVYVFTRGSEHRKLAMSLGAHWAGAAEDRIDHRMDSSIIFAPAGGLVPLALGRLEPGGTLALGGIHMSPIPQTPYDLFWHERRIQSVANSTRQDVTDFLRAAAEIPVETTVELFPLQRANEVLSRLKAGAIQGAAVLTTA
jgi:alcohol dehydrogenase, propanol-preferring